MTSPPPSTLAALMPQAYLNIQASPLGPALRQVVLAARMNGSGLETLAWDVQGGLGHRMMGTHPCGLVVGVTMEPDPLHQALVWQMDLAQQGVGAGARNLPMTVCCCARVPSTPGVTIQLATCTDVRSRPSRVRL